MVRIVLLAALAVAGCHGPLDVELPADRSNPTWLSDPAVVERTITAADTAARVWGGSPGDLDGYTIHLRHGYLGGNRVGHTTTIPILGGGDIEVSVLSGPSCVEATVVSHEVGHVVIGDGDHGDPRWRDVGFWDRVAAELVAVAPVDDAPCIAELRGKHLR
jgi:hypothetical protein